jgi:GntR family transcriptional repressor for pyruvate dehydrogenase complex
MSNSEGALALHAFTSGLLEPLPMRNAGERIAERLVTAIALGQFAPDERLPTERELAAMLVVSRATAREAMQRLAAMGYVTIRRGRAGGAFVVADLPAGTEAMVRRTLLPEWERMQHLLDLRVHLEAQISRVAAERRSAADVESITVCLEAYEAAGSDRESSRAADQALHRAIARATHNPLFEELSLRLRRQVSLGLESEPYSHELRRRALSQHPQLVTAVIEGDADQAAQLAANHFSLTEKMLRELLVSMRTRSKPTSRPRDKTQGRK